MTAFHTLSWINGTLAGALMVLFGTTPLSEINTLPGVAMVFLYGITAFVIIRGLARDE